MWAVFCSPDSGSSRRPNLAEFTALCREAWRVGPHIPVPGKPAALAQGINLETARLASTPAATVPRSTHMSRSAVTTGPTAFASGVARLPLPLAGPAREAARWRVRRGWYLPGFLVLTCLPVGVRAARAAEAFYSVPISELSLTEGQLSAEDEDFSNISWRKRMQWGLSMRPYAVVDGEGEAYVQTSLERSFAWDATATRAGSLTLRSPTPRTLEGRLYLPKRDWSGMSMVRFRVAASAAHERHAEAFRAAKAAYYEDLVRRGAPGSAWFAFQAQEARGLAATGAANRGDRSVGNVPSSGSGGLLPTDLVSTYDLFSGGRAISENLQIARELRAGRAVGPSVATDSIEGITVAAIDWKTYLEGKAPALDALAAVVPADQHLVLFPSFAQFIATRDELTQFGMPILHSIEPRSEDLQLVEIYERQLGASLSVATRLIGPQLIRSVAITGGDPYFRTGTDLAVLMETDQPEVLQQLLLAQVKVAAASYTDAQLLDGTEAGLPYRGVRTSDRRLSSYLATYSKGVLLTNSLVQVRQIGDVLRAATPSLASLPEYRYFRDRYPLGDLQESAFLFLSDATIRRWCGPRWRIGSSRRLTDVAQLNALQAEHFVKLARQQIQSGPLHVDPSLAYLGELQLGPHGIWSSVYNTLEFQTPISELALDRVSETERNAYARWRDSYQGNWRWAFDPIGMRLQIHRQRLAGDLTIMPLIANSDYNRFVSISRGASIAPGAGDRHDALGHWVLALNTSSAEVRQWSNMASMLSGNSRIDILSWLGQTAALYADPDPFWSELAQAGPDHIEEFGREEGHRLPVALRLEIGNPFKLATFLVAARAFIEQTAPGLTRWESLSYRDQAYVKIGASERARGADTWTEKLAIYYGVAGDALVLTLNESVLKRAIDRSLEASASRPDAPADAARTTGAEPAAPKVSWLGENLAAYADRRLIDVLGYLGAQDLEGTLQRLSWSNLPALNHWRRLFPQRDPLEVHQAFWHARLVCPGGGQYVWNDRYQTYESTVYGHPGEPKSGPPLLESLQAIERAAFGLTFEKDGLRARAELLRSAADPSAARP